MCYCYFTIPVGVPHWCTQSTASKEEENLSDVLLHQCTIYQRNNQSVLFNILFLETFRYLNFHSIGEWPLPPFMSYIRVTLVFCCFHRCEISACYKPKTNEPCPRGNPTSLLPHGDSSDFCSLLCLPITTFSGALP